MDEANAVISEEQAGEVKSGSEVTSIEKSAGGGEDLHAIKNIYRLTQLGNAERLVRRFGSHIHYCYPWKTWLVWDGKRWLRDDTGEVQRLAQKTVRAIYTEAAKTENSEIRGAITSHAKRSETKAAMDGMVALAESQLGIAVPPDAFDRDPMKLNCLSGTINLRDGKLQAHAQKDLITHLAPVKYDPEAKCPRWLAFLGRIFANNVEMIDYIQKMVGYSLTGKVTEKGLFVFCGGGDNGKTTMLEAIRDVMGDYAAAISIDALMQGSQDSVRERETARLVGKRFVTSSETEEGQRLNESKIKNLTGMGRLTGRHIYGKPFEFDPCFKLFVDANHKPTIRGTDEAIWNRIRLIPFNVSIPKTQQDKTLRDKLGEEGPGILAWAVRGCQRWLTGGLGSPKAVNDAVNEYREEMDLVSEFIDACCEKSAGAQIASATLYGAYERWCRSIREEPMTLTSFGKRLGEKGFESGRSSSERCRMGLRLREQQQTLFEVPQCEPSEPAWQREMTG